MVMVLVAFLVKMQRRDALKWVWFRGGGRGRDDGGGLEKPVPFGGRHQAGTITPGLIPARRWACRPRS